MPNDTVFGKSSSDIENVDWNIGTTQLPNVARFGSSSSQTSQNSGDICRICHCESDPQNPLLTPCYCSGSLKFVHQTCLQQWLTASETNSCELCKFPFIMHTKIKPFNEWRSLDMSGVERRRLFCAVLFHFATALCVIWSLCVLIERAAEEVKRGLIGWPFWTKLVVVTVGLTGGVVFMYIQCRQYLHLCHRWRARNRILLIQNAPEKMHPLSPPSPILIARHNLPRNGSSSTSNGGAATSNLNRPSTGQIVANIENNPMHYDRDWTLDDSSQSSFKPCLQGSGSMTPLPFHDSVHNMYENPTVRSSSSTSDDGGGGGGGVVADLTPSVGGNANQHIQNNNSTVANHTEMNYYKMNAHPVNAPNYSNSAVFLENSDILNDSDYPKLYHRHSSIFVTHEINENIDKLLSNARRYSDTRLLKHDSEQRQSTAAATATATTTTTMATIFNVPSVSVRDSAGTTTGPPRSDHCTDQTTDINVTDIIFESGAHLDPLELNIQEMLELDVKQNRNQQISTTDGRSTGAGTVTVSKSNARHSLNDVILIPENCGNFSVDRKIFKSLPNLSGSSENLLQK